MRPKSRHGSRWIWNQEEQPQSIQSTYFRGMDEQKPRLSSQIPNPQEKFGALFLGNIYRWYLRAHILSYFRHFSCQLPFFSTIIPIQGRVSCVRSSSRTTCRPLRWEDRMPQDIWKVSQQRQATKYPSILTILLP